MTGRAWGFGSRRAPRSRMFHNDRVAEQQRVPTSAEHDREEAAVRAVRRRELLAMTPAERLALMDRLCRELTRIAATAQRRE